MSVQAKLFLGLILAMLGTALYLYFFPTSLEQVEVASQSLTSNNTLVFDHPLFGYHLSLPYRWKDKYTVTEVGPQTNFWWTVNDEPILLFSLALRPSQSDFKLAANEQTLGQLASSTVVMIKPTAWPALTGLTSAQWQEDLQTVAASFGQGASDTTEQIRQALAQEILASNNSASSSISFLVFENLATEETASSSLNYLWLLTKQLIWQNNLLQELPAQDMPVLVTLDKDSQRVLAVKIFKPGQTQAKQITSLIPLSLRQNNIFISQTAEHHALLDKLSDELDNQIKAYFGIEPVVSKLGMIVTPTSPAVPLLRAKLTQGIVSTSSLAQYKKMTTQEQVISISSATEPLLLVKPDKTASSSTTTISIPPETLTQFLNATSSAIWRKQLFWFSLQGNELVKIWPAVN